MSQIEVSGFAGDPGARIRRIHLESLLVQAYFRTAVEHVLG